MEGLVRNTTVSAAYPDPRENDGFLRLEVALSVLYLLVVVSNVWSFMLNGCCGMSTL